MTELLDLSTDVLVIGGGPAGAWAALRAAQSGADVVLVDKGYCGTSGATAPSGTGVWYVQPDPTERAKAKASRETLGGHLADHQWMDRVLHQTYVNMNLLGEEGRYPFPVDPDTGQQIRTGLQGPEYMRRMRAWIKRAGVRILDHSPALELLVDADGVVRGAAGYQRQDHRDYRVAAGAVVIASGGCAFLSRALGTNVDTGDGALMAAEVGATFSGMEFSNAYAIVPANSTITKTAYYGYATFFRADGSVLEGAGSTKGRSVIARTLLSEPVYAQLDRADDVVQRQMRLGQPNFFLQFDRRGINPFTDRFEVSMLAEGTVRGTGGIEVVDDSCATTVPGLFAAGDAATRERICGGFTGGGSHNSAWAMSSGSWAGTGAAGFARSAGRIRASELRAVGRAGLRPTSRSEVDAPAVVAAAQAELLPYEKNLLRDGGRVQGALDELESLWTAVSSGLGADSGDQRVRARQAGGDHCSRPLDVPLGAGTHRDAGHEQASRFPRPRPVPAPSHPHRRPGRSMDRGRSAQRCRIAGGFVIEVVLAEACIGCDKCVDACPTNVFDRTESGVPVIARQSDCQTCFMCEAYCPVDALYVDPRSTPLPDGQHIADEHIGRYREKLGWGKGRIAGSLTAIGPALPHGAPPPRLRP